MEMAGVSESQGTWHGCPLYIFIHYISSQQPKRKTNHNEQFKARLISTEPEILMVTLLMLLVSYFQR